MVRGGAEGYAHNQSKLADYLLRVAADYDDFDMGTCCKLPGTEREFGPGDAHPCGSVGCALGHGPRAGIHPVLDDDTWPDYCESQFGMRWFSDEAEWCFGGAWSMIDDTPRGAGLRIRLMLERSEERCVRQGWVSTCKFGWAPY